MITWPSAVGRIGYSWAYYYNTSNGFYYTIITIIIIFTVIFITIIIIIIVVVVVVVRSRTRYVPFTVASATDDGVEVRGDKKKKKKNVTSDVMAAGAELERFMLRRAV